MPKGGFEERILGLVFDVLELGHIPMQCTILTKWKIVEDRSTREYLNGLKR